MTHYSRKEKFESALSKKQHVVTVRTSQTPLQALAEAYRNCCQGNWKKATTNLCAAMNICLTTIVHPRVGANRKN